MAEKIRPLQVGDRIIEGTRFILNFDNFSEPSQDEIAMTFHTDNYKIEMDGQSISFEEELAKSTSSDPWLYNDYLYSFYKKESQIRLTENYHGEMIDNNLVVPISFQMFSMDDISNQEVIINNWSDPIPSPMIIKEIFPDTALYNTIMVDESTLGEQPPKPIKGLVVNQDEVQFVSIDGDTIDGDLVIEGDLTVNGNIDDGSSFEIVTFQDGTDAEIAKMLKAHYRGDINIEDYWHVGDTRKIHIDATNSGTQDHVAQDMTMVIMDFNHDDLTTSINDKTKAAVSVGFRETMGNNGTSEGEYYWGSSHYPVADTDNYSANPLRTWLNGGLLNALPSTFSSLIKEVNKKNLVYHSKADEAPLITKDKIWLLSYPEVFGAETFIEYLHGANPNNYEGEQYQYFATFSNKIKYSNKNGEKESASEYWLRSPSSFFYSIPGWLWCIVEPDGSANHIYGGSDCGLAPAFCL